MTMAKESESKKSATIKLLPCPFCGAPAEVIGMQVEEIVHGEKWGKRTSWMPHSVHFITCPIGLALHDIHALPKYTTPEAAARAWNTRKGESRGQAIDWSDE